MDQECGSAAALDKRSDRRPARPNDQVTFPMAGNGTVFGLGGTLAEDHVGGDVPLGLVP